MDRYRNYRSDCRQGIPQSKPVPTAPCDCIRCDADIFHHVDEMPLAMGYVPMQKWKTTFELCKGLSVGTIFPELCKPFVGKRGRI